MPLRVLVTGFEPFDHAPTNPSGDVARHLDQVVVQTSSPGGTRSGRIIGAVLPVLWDVAGQKLVDQIQAHAPHIVISVGMAADTFHVEQYADDRRIDHRDNAGANPGERSGRILFHTQLPIAAIEREMRNVVGASRVEPSADAGGFICNEVFFTLMRAARSLGHSQRLLRAGFIHTPSNVHVPSQIPQARVDEAIREAVKATIADLTEAEYASTQP